MKGFIIGTAITAIAFYVLTRFLPQIGVNYDGELAGLLVLAIIFGVVNGLIGPIVKTLALPISVMTMGLVGFLDQRRAAAGDRPRRRLRRVQPDRRRLPARPLTADTLRRRRRSASVVLSLVGTAVRLVVPD